VFQRHVREAAACALANLGFDGAIARGPGTSADTSGPGNLQDSSMRWWKPRKSNPSAPLARCTIRVFSGCRRNPRVSRTAAACSRACSACSREAAQDDQVVCVSDQHSQPPCPPPAHASSSMFKATLASSGEIGDPCGVPASMAETIPPRRPPPEANPAAASTSAGH